MNVGNSATQQEITTFSDEKSTWDYSVMSQPDATFSTAETGQDGLENFFSRPLKIREYEWGTGTLLYQNFNPWSLYFQNPRVMNRIVNYNNLRCKLCVKVIKW
jgi:hypothetical protein